ncbi:MAG: prepilin-type N-terminal cleavage/methylation domain-containing protein, partial [Firmicutes bacterium]|nr:prepilin-type N-terminal cleavage/methylation domain-containing protein [Bacillota bacterium]
MRRSFDHKKKKGFSLTEMLATIAIIVILIAIAVPSIISIRRSLEFKKMNNYAKEIFMAAQSNLVDRHVAGTLKEIRDKLDAENDRIPSLNNAQFPASEYSSEYYYITSGTTVSPAFDLVLPAGSIDPTLRDKKIMIEFNPYTGNVFSVFYSEGEEDLDYSNVTRVTSDRKKIMLGYYDGSGLSSDSAGNVVKQPTVELVSGQEAIVRITVPIPESYYDKPTTFRDHLDVSAVVKGEQYKGQFGINDDQFAAKQIVDGNKVVVDFCIDSLNNRMSFAGIGQNNPAGTARNTAAISKPADLEDLKDLFVIQPGENVTIEATVSLNAPVGMETVTFNTVSVGGVNPMFESLQKINSGSARTYDLYISNGRQLQNLNAISPLIAKQIGNVYISKDIYWNETVTYYNNKYASGGTFTSAPAEQPARGLPYFVPISNEYLFGLASFSQGGTGSLPALSDTQDGDDLTADFNGGKNKILYLNINGSAVNIGKDYYAGNSEFGKDRFTGLFSYVDTMISGVYVVNPIVQGMSFTGVTGQPATGALVGAAGHNTFLYDCGVYIDKADTYYTTYGPLSNFKVTGSGAVGGLVGYAKSHRTTTGELSQDKAHLAFSQCFAAIPVTGNMRGNSDKCYGYTNGVGGIVGVSMLTNFYNCYASGAVNSTGAMASGSSPLRYSMGTGGFVGTSHGTKYSNCFATGDVWGTEAATGGFVGIVNYDEGFNYINSIYGTKRISQTTVFSSCYCCGVVNGSGGGKNDSGKGKFSGQFACANLRDANGNTMSDPAAHNYYDRWRDSDPYVYKDSYFLNMVSQKVNGNGNKKKPQDNSIADSCAELVAYSDLVDVPVFQSVQSIQKGDSRYQTGFLVADWEAATYQTTHPYSMDSGVYPFSKLTEMDYYGDWVSFTPSAGLAYYEYYDKNGNSIGYYFDRNDVTNDKKSGDLTLGNQTVYSDGYAIMINHDANANGWPIHEINLWVNGVKIPIGKNSTNMLLQLKGDNPTINGVKYHAYRIQPELMQIIVDATKEHPGEFYGEIVISMEFKFTGQQYFNMFFNPQFAMTQINSVFVSDQLQSPAVKPEGLPEKIGIRSPRQMRELAIDQRYWDKGYNFELETDLDMSLY